MVVFPDTESSSATYEEMNTINGDWEILLQVLYWGSGASSYTSGCSKVTCSSPVVVIPLYTITVMAHYTRRLHVLTTAWLGLYSFSLMVYTEGCPQTTPGYS